MLDLALPTKIPHIVYSSGPPYTHTLPAEFYKSFVELVKHDFLKVLNYALAIGQLSVFGRGSVPSPMRTTYYCYYYYYYYYYYSRALHK